MTINDLRFFEGKRVFITGHTGFKGAWLSQMMMRAGAEVCGYSLPLVDEESHYAGLGLKNVINHLEGDIRDAAALSEAIINFQPEIVFHLAAQALVKFAYADPVETYSTNVMGSLNLLEAVNKCSSVRSLVYITSDKCYENFEWKWGYRESDVLGGHDPYSSSKAAAELLFSSYSRSYYHARPTLGAASVRAGNVVGGGDNSPDRIVPDCIRAIRQNKQIELRNPTSTRPWQHVLEPLSGYALVAQKLFENPKVYSHAWNFGPEINTPVEVGQVAQAIVKVYGKGSISMTTTNADFHEANLLQLNCDLARYELGWRPRWEVEKTLEQTANWYRLVDAGEPIARVTDSQIDDYFGACDD